MWQPGLLPCPQENILTEDWEAEEEAPTLCKHAPHDVILVHGVIDEHKKRRWKGMLTLHSSAASPPASCHAVRQARLGTKLKLYLEVGTLKGGSFQHWFLSCCLMIAIPWRWLFQREVILLFCFYTNKFQWSYTLGYWYPCFSWHLEANPMGKNFYRIYTGHGVLWNKSYSYVLSYWPTDHTRIFNRANSTSLLEKNLLEWSHTGHSVLRNALYW